MLLCCKGIAGLDKSLHARLNLVNAGRVRRAEREGDTNPSQLHRWRNESGACASQPSGI